VKRNPYPALIGGSFLMTMWIILSLFQYHLRSVFDLPYSKTLYGFSFFIFASFTIGLSAALLFKWLRKKSNIAGVLSLFVFALIEAAGIGLFFFLAELELNITANWILFLVSLYILGAGVSGYLSIGLSEYAATKMANETPRRLSNRCPSPLSS